MKRINIFAIVVCLVFGFTIVADETAEVPEEKITLRKRIFRRINHVSARVRMSTKIDIEDKKNVDSGVKLPAFDEYLSRLEDEKSERCSRSESSSKSSSHESWTSTSASWQTWSSYSDKTSSSESSEKSSSSDSSDKSSSSDSSDKSSSSTSRVLEEDKLHLQYDYFADDYIRHVVANNFRYVLVGTGWSESSLGKMNLNNQEKQKRAFALSYAQMLKIDQLEGQGRLIYLTTSPINPNYRRYLYRMANKDRLRGMREEDIESRFSWFEKHSLRVVYFSPKGRERNPEVPSSFLSEKANRYLQIKLPKALNDLTTDLFFSNHFVGFTAHFSGPYLEQLAQDWNLPYLVNPSSQAHQIKKSKSRQSFRNAGVPHPRGTYEPAFSVDALVDDIYNLLVQLDHKKVIMKLDQSAAGYGNRVMKFEEITNDMSEEEAKAIISKRFQNREIFPESFIKRIEGEDGAIVEEFIDCKNYRSPASLYMINGVNDVKMRYTYDQLLGGEDNQVYQGSLGPINVNRSFVEGDLIGFSLRIGAALSQEGVAGNIGTDYVTCDADDSENPDRLAFAIENNVRMTGTSYPYYTMMTLVGEDLIKTKYMKSFDDVKIPIITHRIFRHRVQRGFYLSFLARHPDALNVTTARGCIIHNDTFRLGKLGVSCLADSKDEVVEMYDRFSKSIYQYIDEHDATYQYRIFTKTTAMMQLRMSLHETKKVMEQLIPTRYLATKHIDILFDNETVFEEETREGEQKTSGMKKEALELEFQQRFFSEKVYAHPAYFNAETGTGCMVNNDIFRLKQLGAVCMWDQGAKPQHYVSFFEDLKKELFLVKSEMPSEELDEVNGVVEVIEE